jgi:hypothetical protein
MARLHTPDCLLQTEARAILVALGNDLAYVVQAVVSLRRLPGFYTAIDSIAPTGTQLCVEDHRLPRCAQRHDLGALAQRST